eukprot:UN01598
MFCDLILSFIFSKSKLSPLFLTYNFDKLVCRVVTIFLLAQRTRLIAPLRCLEYVRKAHGKCCTYI